MKHLDDMIFPLVSVLMANYNNARYIDEAIHSVFNQEYTNWEIIIVDDDSTDDSLDVLSKYNDDPRINVFVNRENKGCGFTKEKCVNYSSGTYCAFLDPDDKIPNNAIKVLVDKIQLDKTLSLVTSRHYLCDEEFNIKGKSKENKPLEINETYFTSNSFLITALALFSKKHYDLTSGIDENLKRAVDQDLYYKLEEVGGLEYVNLPLYYYRRHILGISAGDNALKALYWHQLVKKSTWKRRKKNYCPNLKKKQLIKSFESYFYWKAIQKNTENKKGKALCLLLNSFRYETFTNTSNKLGLLKKILFGE